MESGQFIADERILCILRILSFRLQKVYITILHNTVSFTRISLDRAHFLQLLRLLLSRCKNIPLFMARTEGKYLHQPSIISSLSDSVVLSSARTRSSALQIHSTYPVNSFSSLCCSFSAMNPALDSTLSFSLANSLKTTKAIQLTNNACPSTNNRLRI